MAIDREKALDRIRKLLNHAKGPGERMSEAEVESYLKHARKLMDEFNVNEQEVMQSEDGQKAAYDSILQEKVYSRASRLDQFMVQLGKAVKIICDVGYYLHHDGTRQYITFYGLPRDVAIAGELYKELLTAMRVMCKVRYGESRPKEYKHYCLGFAMRLVIRANESKEASVQACNTTAIVLVKDGLVNRWKEEHLSFLQSGKARTVKVSRGFGEGYEDGKRVSLDTNQITASNMTRQALP